MTNIKKIDGSFIIEINKLPYHTMEGDKYFKETLELYILNPELFTEEILPEAPNRSYSELRQTEYLSIAEQLDMIYHDRINNTDNWISHINYVKNKYPKNS